MGRVEGKRALVTGAARGQGRHHAVRLAEEGADVVLLDICADIPGVGYPMATAEDLDETVRLVEKFDRQAVAAVVDVRDRAALGQAISAAAETLGGLDIVVANAGICPIGPDFPVTAFAVAVDVDLVGVVNTIHAALPFVSAGGSIIATGSVAAMLPDAVNNPGNGPGGAGYGLAKQFIADYVVVLARQLAAQRIRVNAVHPTNCNTDMLHSPPMYKAFRKDLAEPTRADAEEAFPHMQAMPIPYVEPDDIAHAVIYLASDESRYVTGLQLPVDGGALLKI
ncbi:mycofactocin-coupled SDR family oxidoreductase [Mycolicibacterium holsaticum]|uniref:mycofactocin-coupled SDR family oxidoreductase n=1 Tax=Mycolicibacterium holsaticum TaxID=152142 RepID=UPI001C7D75FB|nr:mycofactocin-coupled SDR family oxidoreductase [Mycolicibacterium holsaticum]MDA4108753.1 3-ketoacyl-ACP reductase [Mycolicibacterium holsaticum DSM 44478 = JCM 12374]QZA12540.1 mycofactocin-coupled SDR family oxidoreductase [Mycolicibacterium holsaticum DSM 44478 = JCM 12374]UNC12171.1 mycofactocin-coupled SDR family oxidoreductase [Mycolicibacterium holsaticum DSM 44478 = JCM 12374]